MTPVEETIVEPVCLPESGDPAELSAQLLRAMIDGMRCGVLAVDREGRLILLNEQARRILELTTEPSFGTPLTEAIPGCPELAQAMDSAFHLTSLPNRAEIELPSAQRGSRTKRGRMCSHWSSPTPTKGRMRSIRR